MLTYHFAARSRNSKTGPIPVTTTAKASCWEGCPFFDSGCYAAEGFHSRLHWGAVSDGKRGGDLGALCASIAKLPSGQLWRHNQAGDLPGIGAAIDASALGAIVEANQGRRGFTYTHKPMNAANAAIVAKANARGFTVNLSGNSLSHADELAELAIAPVVTVLPIEYARKAKGDTWLESVDDYKARTAHLPKTTPAGRAMAVCPATYRDTNCRDCGLCQSRARKVIVGFPAHGQGAAKVDAVARR